MDEGWRSAHGGVHSPLQLPPCLRPACAPQASALLGIKLQADWLLMLTDADAIYDPGAWPKEQRPLPSPIPCSRLQQLSFASGSMAPKVAAACRFASATGARAAVGSIADALAILQGRAGTVITAG